VTAAAPNAATPDAIDHDEELLLIWEDRIQSALEWARAWDSSALVAFETYGIPDAIYQLWKD
jgi:hypothetical protein